MAPIDARNNYGLLQFRNKQHYVAGSIQRIPLLNMLCPRPCSGRWGCCSGQDRPGSLSPGLLLGAIDAGRGDMDDTLKSKCVVSVHVTPGNDRNKHKMNGLGAWRHLAQGLREGGIRDQTCLEGGGKLWRPWEVPPAKGAAVPRPRGRSRSRREVSAGTGKWQEVWAGVWAGRWPRRKVQGGVRGQPEACQYTQLGRGSLQIQDCMECHGLTSF